MRRSPRPWTPEEVNRLRELATERSLRSAATALLRHPTSVLVRARREGITFARRDSGKRWERLEILTLWELAGKWTPRQIARKLGREEHAVHAKAARLGIRLGPSETIADVAAYLGVSYEAVVRHRNRLGQKWRRRHSPRGPEIEEVRAIARAIAEGKGHGIGNLKTSIVRLRRIGEGRA